ncbi:hypothetical protein TcasGA2_TC014657 [Tribolium castaneum]|uniref:Uncharacterized protein n=1 Tax=Tribolium castaneum TaxID=7070 RepID=D6WNE6_TRICA|nr:hypothetical protein TcasGA2_TC014657 [Tribolium castaneum]
MAVIKDLIRLNPLQCYRCGQRKLDELALSNWHLQVLLASRVLQLFRSV